ncbi:MAG: hypothetical protein GKC04_08980 [Methanomicrobiales archaeon]|nr:hypothetical protein [Methanomicrobiales archaeon]
MNASRKRTILLVATVLVGSILVLLDAPLELVLLGTTATGMLLVVLLGNIKGGDEQQKSPAPESPAGGATAAKKDAAGSLRSRIRLPAIRLPALFSRKGTKSPEQKGASPAPAAPKKPEAAADRMAALAPLAGKLKTAAATTAAVLMSVFRKKSGEPSDIQKIDEMLDKTVAEPVSEDEFPGFDDFDFELDEEGADGGGLPAAQPGMELDELDALAVNDILSAAEEDAGPGFDADISLDFDMPEITDEPQTGGMPEGGPDIPMDGMPGDLPAIPDTAEGEISLSAISDTDGISPLSDLEGSFSGLDGIDLADIEVEEAFDDAPDEVISPPEVVAEKAPVKEVPAEEPIVVVHDEIGSFGAADGDLDLMSQLKADSRALKSKADPSLLRDLADVPVTAEELETELEAVKSYFDNRIAESGKKGTPASVSKQ